MEKSKDGNKDDEEGSQVQMEGELCDGHVAKGFTVVLVIFVRVSRGEGHVGGRSRKRWI